MDLVARGDSREAIRAKETPIFIVRLADSPESLQFPIRANHPIRANLANRFARIMPLRYYHTENQVSLVRTSLPQPDSDGKSTDFGVGGGKTILNLAHQNRTIAIASDFRVDGAKSPEIPQKELVLGSEIAARNRKRG